MKIGLFFGTFNPIHVGHLIIANHMAQHANIDQVWLVVTPHNPHKEKATLLADHLRLDMVRDAIFNAPQLKASDIEFHLPKPNYTISTLTHLQEKYPQDEFSLLLGEDNLRSFHKWYNWEQIIAKHRIFVYPRQRADVTEQAPHPALEQHRLAPAVFIPTHMESFLGKALPGRNDQKPVQILRELETGGLAADKLVALKAKFSEALALGSKITAPDVPLDSTLPAFLNQGRSV